MASIQEKITSVKTALYSEMSRLVVTGKDGPAGAIDEYLKEADDASFLRLYDLLVGDPK